MITKNELKAKCFNHFDRESVAICTSCNVSFCRECVSFYEEKMTCSQCIKTKLKKSKKQFSNKLPLISVLILFIFLSSGWAFFYILGMILAKIPSEFSK